MGALRAYAPLNSVVANVGLVYTMLCLCCPPRCASGRCGKAGLLVLWPLLMVVLPLALHYWLLHPEMFRREGSSQLGNPGKLFDFWSSQPLQAVAVRSESLIRQPSIFCTDQAIRSCEMDFHVVCWHSRMRC